MRIHRADGRTGRGKSTFVRQVERAPPKLERRSTTGVK